MTAPSNPEELVLILAPTGRDAPLTSSALFKAGMDNRVCRDVSELLAKLEKPCGAALIAQEAFDLKNIHSLVQKVKEQPAWSDFPFVIFTSAGEETQELLKAFDVVGQLGNVTLVERPVRFQTLRSALQAVLRGRRRQYQIRDLLLQQERSLERLQLLAEIASFLLSAEEPREILDHVFQKLSQPLHLDLYLNYLLDEPGKKFRLNTYAGITASVVKTIECLDFSKKAFNPSKPETPSAADPRLALLSNPGAEWLRPLRLTAFAAYPLVVNQKLFGTLSFGSRTRGAFSPNEFSLMETVCNQVTVALERKRGDVEIKQFNQVLERKVEERTAALKESNENMKSFSYSVSHDLQAPLRAIRGFSDILLTEHAERLNPQGKDYLGRIVKSAGHMDALIQDLLTYSRVSGAEYVPQPVSVEGCALQVLNQLAEEIRQRKAEVILKKPLPEVSAQPGALEQIMANFMTNALKFMKPGAIPKIQISAEKRGSAIRIWVADNGIGIPKQHQDRVFGVFERLHPNYPGTGMGLAIAKKASERLGGQIGVDSDSDQGSRFWVELPAVPANPPA